MPLALTSNHKSLEHQYQVAKASLIEVTLKRNVELSFFAFGPHTPAQGPSDST